MNEPRTTAGLFGELRPKLSVCMAIYNGKRYLPEQIESVLPQLDSQDEVIIVDDGSTDGTREMIEGFGDPRIILLKHERNQGVIASFEDAVRNATGEILFLCDCDDIWAPDRVSATLKAFSENNKASIVVVNIALIDINGNRIEKDKRLKQRPFDSRFLPNFVANRFQGSAMAFRADLLPEILPFPRNVLFVHDAWIGARSALAGRQTVYLKEPLLFYRRHGGNDSGSLPFGRAIRKRIELLIELLLFSLRRRLPS